jgi:hypothetical protein
MHGQHGHHDMSYRKSELALFRAYTLIIWYHLTHDEWKSAQLWLNNQTITEDKTARLGKGAWNDY